MSYPFQITQAPKEIQDGKVGWRCPSNIAIVKYWGKYGTQLPRNASLSLTLTNAHTDTYIGYRKAENDTLTISFLFEGQENKVFATKIENYLKSVSAYYPWLKGIHLDIESSNSFPHSSGIASSASAMAAISMCINEIDSKLSKDQINLTKASYLARLGSGSASRSLIPEIGVWGSHPDINDSSNLYAVSVDDIAPVFKTFHDDILIVSDREKSVSSSAGHGLMEGNVYATARYDQANLRISQLYEAMKVGDVTTFGKIAEDEAMTLHALMMCSDPSYVLMEPGTLDMIREIRSFREKTGLLVFFTLDAGPNIHLLYPDEIKDEIETFVNNKLLQFTVNNRVIKDKVGHGPQKLV